MPNKNLLHSVKNPGENGVKSPGASIKVFRVKLPRNSTDLNWLQTWGIAGSVSNLITHERFARYLSPPLPQQPIETPMVAINFGVKIMTAGAVERRQKCGFYPIMFDHQLALLSQYSEFLRDKWVVNLDSLVYNEMNDPVLPFFDGMPKSGSLWQRDDSLLRFGFSVSLENTEWPESTWFLGLLSRDPRWPPRPTDQ